MQEAPPGQPPHSSMSTSDDVPRQQPKRKRVITAARKEQNKLAQRAYRRRQKEQRARPASGTSSTYARTLAPRPIQTDCFDVTKPGDSSGDRPKNSTSLLTPYLEDARSRLLPDLKLSSLESGLADVSIDMLYRMLVPGSSSLLESDIEHRKSHSSSSSGKEPRSVGPTEESSFQMRNLYLIH
ncbi:hypothetical protein F5Y15DRAFT_402120 [Xylariaceae sp. FL0016]|nr:hypothetical protein F5Y15DRAFT_402120 [Xylariaceae sp. FL0016]